MERVKGGRETWPSEIEQRDEREREREIPKGGGLGPGCLRRFSALIGRMPSLGVPTMPCVAVTFSKVSMDSSRLPSLFSVIAEL